MTDSDIVEIASLVHRRWSEAFDILKHVRSETDNGSPDWNGFHDVRLTNAEDAERKWNEIRTRYINEHRAVIAKSFGI
jgi:hypothetical protein